MRRFSLCILLLAVTACGDVPDDITGPDATVPALASVAPAAAQVPSFRPGTVIARFAAGAPVPAIAAAHGATPLRTLRLGAWVLRVPEGREQQIVEALRNNPQIVYAELSVPRTLGLPCTAGDGDCQPPTDQLFGLRWDLYNDGTIKDEAGDVLWSTGLVPDADSDWLEAFDQLVTFPGTARLGVIDTGIFGGHSDLAGRLVAEWDFFNGDPTAEDDNGHGSHVSGIGLAHGDNLTGAPGIAWGPNVELIVAKGCGLTLFGYICWSDDIANGISWAVDNGANVINLSLGGDSGSQVEQEALQYALANDVLPVCAAGNDQSAVDFPAAFPECMAVSATDWADQLSSYSSFGPEVEVAAPGGDTILASGYDRILSTWNNGGYVFAAGTSMASPHVAGLATLLHALGVTSAADKRQIIRVSAEDLGPTGPDVAYGDGRVNVWNAVLTALGEPPPPPPPNVPPTADFTSDCTDNACDFTDASTDSDGLIIQWSWDFGDGAVSTSQNPSHAYDSAGDYTVSLTVTDNRGATDVVQQSVTVTDPPPNQPPTAAFTYGCTDNVCAFTDASTDSDGSVMSWSWDFGDGATSTEQNPSHAYDAAGDYTVSLTVTDNEGLTDTAQQTVSAGSPPPGQPVAGFTWDCTDNVCVFTDTSTDSNGTITQWSWDFGDGSFSTTQSPSHYYASGGDYTVTLGVTDNDGMSDVVSQTVTVGDPPPPPPNEAPAASFTYSCDGQMCYFTDTSTDPDANITQWSWDFGDGSFSTTQSPSHYYSSGPGTYTVVLGITDAGGLTDTHQETITVGDPPPPSNEAPTAAFTYGCTDLSCAFTDASTDSDGSVVSWSWDFGDGATSTEQNPSHAYDAAGDYTVSLTVTDNEGLTDTAQQTVSVTEPPSVDIVLTATGTRVQGRHVIDLAWTGSSASIDVYRGGVVITTLPSGATSYQDTTGQRGQASYTYMVCEAGTAVCSNEEVVAF